MMRLLMIMFPTIASMTSMHDIGLLLFSLPELNTGWTLQPIRKDAHTLPPYCRHRDADSDSLKRDLTQHRLDGYTAGAFLSSWGKPETPDKPSHSLQLPSVSLSDSRRSPNAGRSIRRWLCARGLHTLLFVFLPLLTVMFMPYAHEFYDARKTRWDHLNKQYIRTHYQDLTVALNFCDAYYPGISQWELLLRAWFDQDCVWRRYHFSEAGYAGLGYRETACLRNACARVAIVLGPAPKRPRNTKRAYVG